MHLLDKVKKAIAKIESNLKNRYWDSQPPAKLLHWFNNPNGTVISEWWRHGIPSIDNVMHGSKNPRSTTTKWFGIDNEEEYKKNISIPSLHKWTKENVNYTFNSHGYRNDEPVCDGDLNILVCGDSHTFGVGLDDAQIWTKQLKILLEKSYKNVKIINLSCPGGSNDWIGRALYCTLQILNPDIVIGQYTYPNRREAIWDSGLLWQLGTSIPDNENQQEYEEFQSWFMTINDHTDDYNMTKNHNLVQATCNYKKIDYFVWHAHQLMQYARQCNSTNHFVYKIEEKDLARDKKHFGPSTHEIFAKQVYETIKKYSKHGEKLHDL